MLKNIYNNLKFIINHPLAKGNKTISLVHFVLWLVAIRLLNNNVNVQWIENLNLLLLKVKLA
jgi:hypothetical protein